MRNSLYSIPHRNNSRSTRLNLTASISRYTSRVEEMSIVGKTYLEKGKRVVVMAQWNGKGPRNVLIEREDGSKVVRPFRGLRKVR